MNGKVSNSEQLCSVKRVQYTDGRENGERVLLAENGCLSFTVLENRALDIYDFRYKGENIAFLSKNGLCGFQGEYEGVFPGGMLYTCGLDTVGGRSAPVHGKIHNLPAKMEKIVCDEKHVEIVGSVRQSSLFGENLVMRRTISTEYGSGTLKIVSEIVNEGYQDSEYCLLFHMNFGYPFLDEGAEITAPILRTQPRTPWAEQNRTERLHISAPTEREEQVYYHTVERGVIQISNPRKLLRATIEYDANALPYFIEWKSMISGDYALGIEPSTTTLDGDFKKKVIAFGAAHRYEITVSVEEMR